MNRTKPKLVYVPNIRTYKIGKRIQKRDYGYWILTTKKKSDKIVARG